MMMEITRRSFLKGTLAGAAGAAAATAMVGCSGTVSADAEPETTGKSALEANVNVKGQMSDPDETHEGDVVIVGSGPAGIACATRLAEEGAKVLIIEKRKMVGGTGLFASGNCYISLNSEFQTSQGLVADIPAFYKEWLEAVHYHCDHEVLSTYLQNCGRVTDWMLGHGFEFYMKKVPDTNGLSGFAYRISQPSRDGDGRANTYNAMVDTALAIGGEISYETTAQELIVDENGAVVGVRAGKEDGTVIDFMGKAVVIASGGFAANQDMVNELCLVPFLGRDPVLNCGEGARMSWAVGAEKPWNLGALCCDTLYLVDKDYNSYSDGIQAIGNAMNDVGKSKLHVNQLGKRFHSEDAFCWVPTYAGASSVAYNEPYLFVIGTQAMIDELISAENSKVTQENVDDMISKGVGYRGDTPEALAEAAGLDVETFARTLDDYNAACAAGKDDVFFKDAKYLKAYGSGPYYAFRMAATPFGSCGDLVVTPRMQVRGTEPGSIVPGLYAAGTETVGIMHNDYYWALGQTVGWAHTSGVLAAEEIAASVL